MWKGKFQFFNFKIKIPFNFLTLWFSKKSPNIFYFSNVYFLNFSKKFIVQL